MAEDMTGKSLRLTGILIVLSGGLAMGGCSPPATETVADPSSEPGRPDPASTSPEAELKLRAASTGDLGQTTKIRLGDDGNVIVQALVTVDGGCASADLWLYDQVGLKGNRLCIFQSPTSQIGAIDLRTISHPDSGTKNWSGKVKSYWGGSEFVEIDYRVSPNPAKLFRCVPPWQQVTDVTIDPHWQDVMFIQLGDHYPPGGPCKGG